MCDGGFPFFHMPPAVRNPGYCADMHMAGSGPKNTDGPNLPRLYCSLTTATTPLAP